MKNKFVRQIVITTAAFLLIAALIPGISYSQCEPDLLNCFDIDEPGQMCPPVLPDGFVGEPYEQEITVLTPKSGNVGELNITISKLRLDSVENLPEGLDYHSETDIFYADEAYCILLSGTPHVAGTFKLKITVTPYISILGVSIPWGEFVDSTSVAINISFPAYIDNPEGNEFSLINPFPNPFSYETRIGFYELKGAETELRVFDLSGKQVYYENVQASIGENYFDFTGHALRPGYYIYTILRGNEKLKGRLIKCY